MEFSDPKALERLDTMPDEELDQLPYGVIGMDEGGTVVRYNQFEAKMAGLDIEQVVGYNFFVEVAPCMNNFMVGQRLLDDPSVDETLPYVLTVRMNPTPVTLRLLKRAESETMYILVGRSGGGV